MVNRLTVPVSKHENVLSSQRGVPLFAVTTFPIDRAFACLATPATPRKPELLETGTIVPECRTSASAERALVQSLDEFSQLVASHSPFIYPKKLPALASGFQPTCDVDHAPPDLTHAPDQGHERRLGFVPSRRHGLWKTWVGCGMAFVSTIVLLGHGGGEDDELTVQTPVIIRADTEAVKIAPAERGGLVVSDQHRSVFGTGRESVGRLTFHQTVLMHRTEEPLDISEYD